MRRGASVEMQTAGVEGEVMSYANRLPRTPVLQDHKFIRESDRTVKSASYFTDENKIKRTLRGIKDRMER